jgi:hypothetical protein
MVRRLAARIALGIVVAFMLVLPAAAQTGGSGVLRWQQTLSDSYYRLDPGNATMQVRVEATVRNADSRDLGTLVFWAMPGAQNLRIARGDAVIEKVKIEPDPFMPPAVIVLVELDRPLRPRARADFVLTYDVPASKSDLFRIEAGAIESAFVSQGAGSFVFIDVPATAENYFDPGCLKAADQPGELKEGGYERWVCGEPAIIALYSDDPSILKKCAALDPKCRQQFSIPFSAFAQSITDPSSRGQLDADVTMPDGRQVKLILRYFKRDQAWADKQFNVAVRAFPILESLYGFPYPFEQAVMRQSHHIEFIGAAGIAFSRIGEVLLATDTGFDEEVTIHELAHQWAGNQLEASWIWEGLAEWGTRVAAPMVGVTPLPMHWQSLGYKDPLASWHHGSGVYDPEYWYGKAGDFWFEYERAVGGRANMTAILARIGEEQQRWPLDGRWFVDTGERVSGANLDALFLEWVFMRETAAPLLQARRAVWDGMKALIERAESFGLEGEPGGLRPNLDVWNFDAAGRDLATANGLLDQYALVLQDQHAAGLPATSGVQQAWAAGSLQDVRSAIESQRQAIAALKAAAGSLADEPADSPFRKRLESAREAFAAGDFAGASRLAAESVAARVNLVAAAKMIELASERQETFSSNLATKVGLMFANPDQDLRLAREAFAEGDGAAALKLSTRAYNAWGGAQSKGVLRLSFLMAVNCLALVGLYFLLRKIELRSSLAYPARPVKKAPPDPPPRPSWRDWENRA